MFVIMIMSLKITSLQSGTEQTLYNNSLLEIIVRKKIGIVHTTLSSKMFITRCLFVLKFLLEEILEI